MNKETKINKLCESSYLFSKEDSLFLKGIAICMMMLYHCLQTNSLRHLYKIGNYLPLSASQVGNIGEFFKICVSVFVFISGYGLYLSYREKQGTIWQWLWTRLIKTLSGFWFIVILSWIICTLIDGRIVTVYFQNDNIFTGIINMLLDFFGLANLCSTPLFNSTWWYMSAAVVFILLSPACFRFIEKFGSCYAVICGFILPRLIFQGFPGVTNSASFFPIFIIGAIFARENSFTKIFTFFSRITVSRIASCSVFCGSLIFLALCYKISASLSNEYYWDFKWCILPLPVIFFCLFYIEKISGLKSVFTFLGKHSANIFMFHTFIRYYYCSSLVYSMPHFLLIPLVLLLLCIPISILLEQLKKWLRYPLLVQKLATCIYHK